MVRLHRYHIAANVEQLLNQQHQSAGEEPMCQRPDHKKGNIPVDLYCIQCKAVMCARCLLTHPPEHSTIPLDEAAKMAKEVLGQVTDTVQKREAEIQAKVKSSSNASISHAFLC